MAPSYRLSENEERKRYELHNNNPQDTEYRKFLRRLADPLCEMLNPGAQGLDFGSGPGPTLSLIMQERGFRVATYDPFFAPDSENLKQQYDFVTATEVIEHLFHPNDEIDQLISLIRPGGLLAVMTEVRDPEIAFGEWHYPRDPTHVAFYDELTMHWIASHWGLEVVSPQRNVRIFRKN